MSLYSIEPFFEPSFSTPPMPPVTAAAPVTTLSRAEIAELIAARLAAYESRVETLKGETQDALSSALRAIQTVSAPKVMAVKLPDMPPRKLTKEAHPKLPEILVTLKAVKPNVLLTGPRGSGKTTLAEQIAESLGLAFGSLTVTAGASETWLYGRPNAGNYQPSRFVELYENGGVFLLDEIDAADPNWLLALNTALENGHFYNPISGKTLKRHPDFFVVAASNTNMRGASTEYSGRSSQDSAAVERFFPVRIDYNEDLERRLFDKALVEKFHEARGNLAAARSIETLSTRSIETYSKAIAAGLPFETAFKALTFGWSESALRTSNLEKLLKPETEKSEEIPF